MTLLLRLMFRLIITGFLHECERKQLIDYVDAHRAAAEVEPFLSRVFPDPS